MLNENIKRKLLSEINQVIKERIDNLSFENSANLLQKNYGILNVEEKRVFRIYLRNLLSDDIQLYMLVLSALYYASRDAFVLDEMEKNLKRNVFSYDLMRGLSKYIQRERFSRGMDMPAYAERKELFQFLINKLKKTYGNNVETIPVAERIENHVVIFTEQLLSVHHAPSHMVMDLCKKLYSLGNKILLVVCAESKNTLELTCENYLFEQVQMNYIEEYWGRNQLCIDSECYVDLIQVPSDTEHLNELHVLENIIREWKPLYAWNVGGEICIAELLGKITTMATIPCSAGLAISNAPILIRYMQNNKSDEEEYAQIHEQTVLDMTWTRSIDMAQPLDRKELGLPKDAFLIVIMGNRLDNEINEEFIDVMRKIVMSESEVGFVIIGDCAIDFKKYGLEERVWKLGYRKDYMSIFRAVDLYMNPKRIGGGSGVHAVCQLLPVITLKDGDVARAIDNEAFTCESYNDYAPLVSKYIHDKEFRNHQIKECETIINRRNCIDVDEEIERIDHKIRSIVNGTG